MRYLFVFFLFTFFIFVSSFTFAASETVLDYFFPVGSSTFDVYNRDGSRVIARGSSYFTRNLSGGELDLLQNSLIDERSVQNHFAVTLMNDKILLKDMDNPYFSPVVVFRLPSEGVPLTWTSYAKLTSNVTERWDFTASLEDDKLKLMCFVYDATGRHLEYKSFVSYWIKNKGLDYMLQGFDLVKP